jgi:hypothetical protein
MWTAGSEYGMFYQTIDPQPVKSQLPMIIEINGRTIRLTALVLYCTATHWNPGHSRCRAWA